MSSQWFARQGLGDAGRNPEYPMLIEVGGGEFLRARGAARMQAARKRHHERGWVNLVVNFKGSQHSGWSAVNFWRGEVPRRNQVKLDIIAGWGWVEPDILSNGACCFGGNYSVRVGSLAGRIASGLAHPIKSRHIPRARETRLGTAVRCTFSSPCHRVAASQWAIRAGRSGCRAAAGSFPRYRKWWANSP
jgi:hypothetical protein